MHTLKMIRGEKKVYVLENFNCEGDFDKLPALLKHLLDKAENAVPKEYAGTLESEVNGSCISYYYTRMETDVEVSARKKELQSSGWKFNRGVIG